jgi:hypothetical protein
MGHSNTQATDTAFASKGRDVTLPAVYSLGLPGPFFLGRCTVLGDRHM